MFTFIIFMACIYWRWSSVWRGSWWKNTTI